MITASLLNLAVVTYALLSSGNSITFDRHAGLGVRLGKAATARLEKEYISSRSREREVEAAATLKINEKIVLRTAPLSEKCGFDLEPIVSQDQEIAAMQAAANGLPSAIDLRARATKKAPWETPNLHVIKDDWSRQFSVSWDDDGKCQFGGSYIPESRFSFFR